MKKYSKKSKKNRVDRVNRVLSVFLCLCLLISGISFSNLTTKVSAGGGTGTDVTDKLSNVKVTLQDSSGNNVIVNNVVESGASLVYKMNYNLMVSWEILQEDFEGQVSEGDYLSLDISNDYFTYTNTSLDNQLIYDGAVIGTWGIQNNKILCTFTANAEASLKASGYFTATGYFSSREVGNSSITIAGVPVQIEMNPVQTGFPYAGADTLYSDVDVIKYGTNTKGSDTIYWDILVNAINATTYYYTKMNPPITDTATRGMMVIDTLPDDLVVDEVAIQVPIYRPKSSELLSTTAGGKLDITSQFTKINQGDMAYGEWLVALRNNDPSYGWSSDGKTVAVFVGSLPGSLKLANNSTEFRTAVKDMNFGLTTDEVDALANIYGIGDIFQVRYIDVVIASKGRSGAFEKDSYQNTASVMTDANGGFIDYQSSALSIEQIDGGIQVVTPKSAKLTKKDYNTGDVISGAKFKLQYQIGSVWEDYRSDGVVVTKTTNEYGQVEFSSLPPAVYRFVEVEAKEGYDINSVQYSVNQFEIKDTDTAGVSITATNKVLPMSILVTKTWEDNGNAAGKRPENIMVYLMNGQNKVKECTLSKDNEWRYLFTDLPVYDSDNNRINYTIQEEEVADYSAYINGYNITNVYEPESDEESSSEESSSEESSSEESSGDETSGDETSGEETSSEETSSEEIGSEETGSGEMGSEETDSGETGHDETDSEETSSDETGGEVVTTESDTTERVTTESAADDTTAVMDDTTTATDDTTAEGYSATENQRDTANVESSSNNVGKSGNTKESSGVKTGDSLNLAILLLSLSSAVVIIGCMINRRKVQ